MTVHHNDRGPSGRRARGQDGQERDEPPDRIRGPQNREVDGFVARAWKRRLELGLTREELAGRLELSVKQLWRIESHKQVPRLDTAYAMSEALCVPLDDDLDV